MLREKLIEYEKQFREIEEKLGDIQAEKMTIDSTYKQYVYFFTMRTNACLILYAWNSFHNPRPAN